MAFAYLRHGQHIVWNKVSYKLERLLDDEWQILDVNTHRMRNLSINNLYAKIATGEIVFEASMPIHTPGTIKLNRNEKIAANLDMYDEHEQVIIKRKRYLLEEIYKLHGDCRSREILSIAIDDIWRKDWDAAPHPATVARWMKRYIEADKNILALAHLNDRKGNRTRRYQAEIYHICEQSIDRVYLQPDRGSINKTLEDAKREVRQENKLRPPDEKLSYPTYSLISSLIKDIPEYDKYARRNGANVARNKFRSSTKGVIASYPLERVEIDHTELDVMLVDEETGLCVSRPTLSIAIDVFSRSIMGFCISYDPPSVMVVARLLKMAIPPKTDLKSKWNGVESDWPMFGVMENLVVDNGLEFHSKSLDDSCSQLGINLTFCQRKTPWWKGHVERALGTMSRQVTDGVPGRTFSSISENAGYDAKKNATISLKAMEEIITIWIVDIYHKKTHSALGMRPYDAWSENIQTSDIPIPTNLEVLDVVMGTNAERGLSHTGISINSLQYNCDELQAIVAKFGPIKQARIKWNPENLGYIYALPPDGTTLTVPVIERYAKYANNLTYGRHKANKKYAKKYFMSDDLEAVSRAHEKMQELIGLELSNKNKNTRRKSKRLVTKTSSMSTTVNNEENNVVSNVVSKVNTTLVSAIKRKTFETNRTSRDENKGFENANDIKARA